MSESVTIELPDDLASRARSLAHRANRPLEVAAVEWIARAVAETPVESLGDNELLAICDQQLSSGQQTELTALLDANREGRLESSESVRLNDLMTTYRRGLVEKARAWREAVARGLRKPPAGDGG